MRSMHSDLVWRSLSMVLKVAIGLHTPKLWGATTSTPTLTSCGFDWQSRFQIAHRRRWARCWIFLRPRKHTGNGKGGRLRGYSILFIRSRTRWGRLQPGASLQRTALRTYRSDPSGLRSSRFWGTNQHTRIYTSSTSRRTEGSFTSPTTHVWLCIRPRLRTTAVKFASFNHPKVETRIQRRLCHKRAHLDSWFSWYRRWDCSWRRRMDVVWVGNGKDTG